MKHLPRIFKKRKQLIPFKPLYDRNRFYEMWEEIFGPLDPNLCMSECKTRFLCTAVNLCDSQTHFFKSWEKKDGCLSLRDAIARSFAAPYFFGALIDEVTKAVWFDGGAGESNTPLNIAYTESINLGWYHEKVEYTAIGTGLVNNSVPFDKAIHLGNLRQLFTFMNPLKGGLARIQSSLNQVTQMRIKAQAEHHIDFHNYDVEIGQEYKGIDKLEYVQEYKAFGSIVAQKLENNLRNSSIQGERKSIL